MKKILVLSLAAAGALLVSAEADARVAVSLGINLPGVAVVAGAPAYVAPPAVYAPAPVYYGAPAVGYVPGAVAYYGPGPYYRPGLVVYPGYRHGYYGPAYYHGGRWAGRR